MKSDSPGWLRLPQGTEGFYLEEAYRHKKLTADVEQLLFQWGYLPVQTPVFDFYDAYASLLSDEESRSVYRLIDREGDLLMLRSDVTLFLAKQMGMILCEEDLPIRVCYADTILRHQNPEDISKNEFFQTGVELLGPANQDADAEVILLLRRTLDTIGIPQFFIHIGSRALFNATFPDVTPSSIRTLRHAIVLRDSDRIARTCESLGVSPRRTTALRKLFAFIGSASELEAMIANLGTDLRPTEVEQAMKLHELALTISDADEATAYRIDLSEIGSQPYHTGVVFQAYVDGLDSAVAAGGRYDHLYGNFGLATPAVGFSVMLRKVQEHTAVNARFAPAHPERAAGTRFIDRFKDAERIRSRGGSVTL